METGPSLRKLAEMAVYTPRPVFPYVAGDSREATANWLMALAAVMSALGNVRRYRAAHANGPTPRRQHHGFGRGMELHRFRKARRLEPSIMAPKENG